MALFCKKIVCSLGNYETLALEVSECSSFWNVISFLFQNLYDSDSNTGG